MDQDSIAFTLISFQQHKNNLNHSSYDKVMLLTNWPTLLTTMVWVDATSKSFLTHVGLKNVSRSSKNLITHLGLRNPNLNPIWILRYVKYQASITSMDSIPYNCILFHNWAEKIGVRSKIEKYWGLGFFSSHMGHKPQVSNNSIESTSSLYWHIFHTREKRVKQPHVLVRFSPITIF